MLGKENFFNETEEIGQNIICENMEIVKILIDARNILRRGGEEAKHLRETIRKLKVSIDNREPF